MRSASATSASFAAGQHHPAAEWRDHELDDAVDALRREHVVQTLQRAGALRREHDAITLADERAQAARQRVGIADDGVERGRGDTRGVGAFGRLQQRHRAGLRVRQQPVEVEGEAREVFVGGRVPGDRERARERRFVVEELLGAVAHALRLDEQGERVVGQEIEQEVLALGQPRQPRLHAVEHLAVGEALPLLAAPPLRAQQLGGALADGGGGEQLTGREDPRFVDVVGGALVGDRERRQPVDLVTPEVDADGVVVGGRVHVDDRAADGDLAPRLHLVLPPVAAGDQRLDQLVAVDPPARPDDDRLDLLDVGPEPLHQRPHRRDHHRRRVLGMAEPPEDAEAPAHGLERRRHPLERQRLPCREQLDLAERGRAGADELRQVAGEPLGLGPGGHRDDERPAGRGRRERGHEQRPRRVGDRHRRRTRDDRRAAPAPRRASPGAFRAAGFRCALRSWSPENATKTRIPRGTRGEGDMLRGGERVRRRPGGIAATSPGGEQSDPSERVARQERAAASRVSRLAASDE